jgi:hypothetical protein
VLYPGDVAGGFPLENNSDGRFYDGWLPYDDGDVNADAEYERSEDVRLPS